MHLAVSERKVNQIRTGLNKNKENLLAQQLESLAGRGASSMVSSGLQVNCPVTVPALSNPVHASR